MAADADLRYVITEEAISDRYGTRALLLTDIKDAADRLDIEANGPLTVGSSNESDLYVLYTSGSTGVPKGVVMQHQSILNLIKWQQRQTADIGVNRTLQRSSLGFDVSFQEIFSTLCFGGTLVIATPDERADVSQLAAAIAKHQVTRVFLPPVTLYQLAEAETQPTNLASLAEVIVAGEQLRISKRVRQLFRGLQARLVNQYGPTETHVVSAHTLAESSMRWPDLPPIGRPIDGAEIYVLDRHGQLAPRGVVGELHVGGVPLARGYLGNDELTARTFIRNPFDSAEESRLYRTGDLGRQLEDGSLEYVGRRDSQVKVRGYRVELGEIEATLGALQGVQQVAATTLDEADGQRSLAAYLVTESRHFSMAQARQHLLEKLPQHMVPATSRMMLLDRLPLTATGKVDRAALPRPAQVRDLLTTEYAPARNELEREIAKIWSEVLNTPEIGLDDGFAELGGHSLAAIRLVSQINERFGVSVPLAAVLQGGTIRRIGELVAQLLSRQSAGESSEADETSQGAPLETVELPNGLRLLTPYPPETSYLYMDVFEHQTYRQGALRYPTDGVYFDVGAHVGLFSLYVLQEAPQATVYAFEPVAALYQALSSNLEPHQDRVTCVPCGLADRIATATLTYYPTLTGMSTLYPDVDHDRQLLATIMNNLGRQYRWGQSDWSAHVDEFLDHRLQHETLTGQLRTMSDFISERDIAQIDLLKIDVQKAELDVLQGIQAEDWAKVKQIVIEVHDRDDHLKKITQMLTERGFSVQAIQDSLHVDSVVWFLYGVLT